MNNITAAVGLGQLERINHLVQRRIAIGEMFNRAVQSCNWMIPQKNHPTHHIPITHMVSNMKGKSSGSFLEEFYTRYKKMGANGFYGHG